MKRISPDTGGYCRRELSACFRKDGTIDVSDFVSEPLALSQIPDDFTTWLEMDSETMTLKDMRGFADRLSQDGTVLPRLMTDYYGRLAYPFVTFVMVIVGIALSLAGPVCAAAAWPWGSVRRWRWDFSIGPTHSVAIALGRGGVLTPSLPDGWRILCLWHSAAICC